MTKKSNEAKRQVNEEVMLKGNELVEFITRVVSEGNVRRLIIRKSSGETLLEIPLTAGLAASGILTLMAPVLAAVGALGALLAGVRVEIIRSEDDDDAEQ